MTRHDDLNFHLCSTPHNRIEIVHFEPQQHTIAIRPVGRIGNASMMVLDLKAVQLQDERAILHQLLILFAAMAAAATQQALIPAAAGFDIHDANEWLRSHGSKTMRTHCGSPIFL